ncbi:MAG TPA: hypothetical protein VE988_05790 [Gemmataceae bacterium]|nr:hypothetical protein [Gemmataceae bacterium]
MKSTRNLPSPGVQTVNKTRFFAAIVIVLGLASIATATELVVRIVDVDTKKGVIVYRTLPKKGSGDPVGERMTLTLAKTCEIMEWIPPILKGPNKRKGKEERLDFGLKNVVFAKKGDDELMIPAKIFIADEPDERTGTKKGEVVKITLILSVP